MTEKSPPDEKAGKTGVPASAKRKKSGPAKPKKSPKKADAKDPTKDRGRPTWQPSIDDRIAVEQMKFVGESDAMIARALKVDVDTLRKHCGYELANGYANQRKKITGLMFKAADEGNASAIKRLDEMGRAVGAAQSLQARGTGKRPDAKPEPKGPPPGKKEQLQQAAESITGKFAAPLAPKLVVNNSAGK